MPPSTLRTRTITPRPQPTLDLHTTTPTTIPPNKPIRNIIHIRRRRPARDLIKVTRRPDMAAVIGAEGLIRVTRSADVRPGQRGRVKEILGDARVDVLGGVAGAGPAAAVDAVADHL